MSKKNVEVIKYQFELQQERRRSILIPILHPQGPDYKTQAKKNAYYKNYYKQLSDIVQQTWIKLQHPVELFFVFPRDQDAYKTIKQVWDKEKGLHDRLYLMVLAEEFMTYKRFMAFLPKLIFLHEDEFMKRNTSLNTIFADLKQQMEEVNVDKKEKYHIDVKNLFTLESKKKHSKKPIYINARNVSHDYYVCFFTDLETLCQNMKQDFSKCLHQHEHQK